MVTIYELITTMRSISASIHFICESGINMDAAHADFEPAVLAECLSGVLSQTKLDIALLESALCVIREEQWSQGDFVTLVASAKYCPYVRIDDVRLLAES